MLRGDGGSGDGVEEPFAKRSLIGTQRRRKCARKTEKREPEKNGTNYLLNIFKMRCRARERMEKKDGHCEDEERKRESGRERKKCSGGSGDDEDRLSLQRTTKQLKRVSLRSGADW